MSPFCADRNRNAFRRAAALGWPTQHLRSAICQNWANGNLRGPVVSLERLRQKVSVQNKSSTKKKQNESVPSKINPHARPLSLNMPTASVTALVTVWLFKNVLVCFCLGVILVPVRNLQEGRAQVSCCPHPQRGWPTAGLLCCVLN